MSTCRTGWLHPVTAGLDKKRQCSLPAQRSVRREGPRPEGAGDESSCPDVALPDPSPRGGSSALGNRVNGSLHWRKRGCPWRQGPGVRTGSRTHSCRHSNAKEPAAGLSSGVLEPAGPGQLMSPMGRGGSICTERIPGPFSFLESLLSSIYRHSSGWLSGGMLSDRSCIQVCTSGAGTSSLGAEVGAGVPGMREVGSGRGLEVLCVSAVWCSH